MHSTRHRYDAVVVGARAAGAATAMLLARAGLTVAVVDRSSYGADTLSTHALMRGAVVQLQRWGLLDEIIAAGTPPIRRTVFHYAHDDVAIRIKRAHGIDALYAPRRTVLDPVLVDAAIDAGADVRYGITVTGVRRDHRDRIVGVDGHDESGHPVGIDARVVIGADGLRSTVARYVDAPVEHQGRAATAVVYGYWSGVETDGYEWSYRGGAGAGLIPTNDDRVCVFAGSTPARVGRGGHAALHAVVRRASTEMADRVAAGRAPEAVRFFAGQPGRLRRSWGPGWALVGDAGSWKDPISAHGITDALRDAELLARAVIAASSGELPEAAALSAYQAERDRLTLPLFDVADRIAACDWSDDDIPMHLLALSASMSEELETIVGFDDEEVAA